MKLIDVANKAGVSVTTVSRVLNGDQNVKTSTRTRVQRAMQDLKYYPNLHARSLARGQSKTLGVLVSNLDNPFFLDIYRRFEALALGSGYDTVVSATHYHPDQLRASLRSMLGRRVAGIAAFVSEMEPSLIDELSHVEIPVVFYDVGRVGKRITNIRSNYQQGMRQLVEHLRMLGHRRMAFIAYPLALQPTEERRTTFLEVTEQLGVSAHVVLAHSEEFSGGRSATRELLSSGFEPTAILCVNDITAVGVLKELHEQGVLVPQQISVAGFDNILLGQFTIPSLTTIHIPRDRIAELAFQALAPSWPNHAKQGQEVLVDLELILRKSTAPPPTESA
ncbi:MAG: LacI family DNA-binding transcriptional regulator [Acidobacteriaceae bacterium]|nr:LacI family DNA-binding transcriptional regulator [Acidobacteriaceae bacterium]MBV9039248.1 LacI family DNA-binding transcriptional regulator [Acidobacteriaceae bacterium]MBV9224158.1 LacI family DNA-binding transcriptional regulator [Acidobacteriaceae bacterium]MBV9304566.1 LacI family DNA-binding transcriptional regulator [Acidobacteriaceae bacterium]